MKRKQIHIDADLEYQLKSFAERRGVSESLVVREALAAYLTDQETPTIERAEDHPLWGIIGLVDDPSAPRDGSVNHDHYLYGGPRKYRLSKAGKATRIRRSAGVR
jgi:hypothetical protein